MKDIYRSKQLLDVLIKGGIVVMPSDTIYGVFGSAKSTNVTTKIRSIKNRDDNQAFIVLCAHTDQITDLFGIEKMILRKTENYWPGPVSIILEPQQKRPDIQGSLDGIAFRIPADESLRELLEKTGPLVAPSANPRGLEPAKNIQEAQEYFGDQIDLYVDGGTIENVKPSKVLKINPDGTEQIFRN